MEDEQKVDLSGVLKDKAEVERLGRDLSAANYAMALMPDEQRALVGMLVLADIMAKCTDGINATDGQTIRMFAKLRRHFYNDKFKVQQCWAMLGEVAGVVSKLGKHANFLSVLPSLSIDTKRDKDRLFVAVRDHAFGVEAWFERSELMRAENPLDVIESRFNELNDEVVKMRQKTAEGQ